jgi:hypothetical protein
MQAEIRLFATDGIMLSSRVVFHDFVPSVFSCQKFSEKFSLESLIMLKEKTGLSSKIRVFSFKRSRSEFRPLFVNLFHG